MDERFERRWGYEDSAWHVVVATLSTVHRLDGVVVSFNHSADWDLSDDNPNRHRYQLYRAVARKPELMRELVKR